MAKFIMESKMEKTFNRLIYSSLIVNALIGIIGVLMLTIPDLSDKVIGIMVGLSFVINGINIGYKFFRRDGAKLYSLNLVFAIISVIVGLLLMVYPFSFMKFVTICLGIYLIVIGSLNVNYGFWFKAGKDESWLLTFVIGCLLIVFGILVIINPFSSLKLTQVIGTFLIILAVLQVTDAVMIKRRAKEIVKIFW